MWSFLLTATALAITPAEVPNPRPSGWVTDVANVIDDDDEAAINRRIDAMHAAMDVEVAVVTIPSIDDRTPKAFATELFNHWGIGDAQTDNGLLVLLAVEQRRLEMETGYGLEADLPAGWLKGMQSDFMVPRFKQGDFGGGIDAGLAQVDSRLRGEPPQPPAPHVQPAASSDSADLMLVGIAGTGGLGTIFLFGIGAMWNHRRLRTCPDCELAMELLPESEEDDHLTPGEEREEQIGSRSWDVYRCPKCEYVRTFGRAHWFSGYSSCPECDNRTRRTSTTTVTPAGTYTSGTDRVTETCVHCTYYSTYTVTTPPLGDDSSSSGSSSSGFSSGGGGFGGGSSGGGGAGSSW